MLCILPDIPGGREMLPYQILKKKHHQPVEGDALIVFTSDQKIEGIKPLFRRGMTKKDLKNKISCLVYQLNPPGFSPINSTPNLPEDAFMDIRQ